MDDFKQFIQKFEEQNTIGTHNDGSGAAFVGTDFSGSEAVPRALDSVHSHLPGMDAIIPMVTKTSKIKFLERNKNPILIYLEDGTRLYLNWDQFKRIKGSEPREGKMMTVIFQRHPANTGRKPSQIQSIEVH